ncbi:ribitol-5-phosphate transferase FKTN-like [Uloborus diversus]|uniref:ribitol-5-phosphate transferase FKTN-like n=1 Tax=Uloborus diversus TaxID=327109 RepID=UPI002409EE82|nr:ribitol-5-phosphate transferase FKTN-like [Uloborus diversus]
MSAKKLRSAKLQVFITKILSLSFKHNVPLFLVDEKVYFHSQNHTAIRTGDCKYLCMGEKVIHFATIGPVSTQIQKNAFIEAVESEGCKVRIFIGSDPVLLQHGLNSPIPLHFVISNSRYVIQVMILYERPGKFWWVGGYHLHDNELHELFEMGLKKEDVYKVTQAASFEKVEIHLATVDQIKMYAPRQYEVFLNYTVNNRFIECNYSQAKTFYDRYGRDESDEAEIFRTRAWKLLAKAKALLDHLKVPFWLSSGTCLGFFRECGVISYSKDVDIGIWIKDYKPEIISIFSTHDIPLTHSFGKVEDSFELSFREKDIKLDIFFFYEEAQYVWNGGTQARTGKKFKYIFPKFELCWTEFLELKVRIPCDTETYIKANYGPNWFEPVKTWDWKSSPPNVIENGQWPIEEWPEVIQLLPLPEQT